MSKLWMNDPAVRVQLGDFFSRNKYEIADFGRTVNQTFEAFVFASLVNWYVQHGWSVEFMNPGQDKLVKLKFNTRGRPSLYTYALCVKGEQRIQVRHGLRVATYHHKPQFRKKANVVLDVSVIYDTDLSHHKTDEHLDNSSLITFGEAKHMAAFAELIANFIGLVHELSPTALTAIRASGSPENRKHPAPFLYVSGHLNPTAQGIVESIADRGFDIDVYDYQTGSFFGISLPVMKPNPKREP